MDFTDILTYPHWDSCGRQKSRRLEIEGEHNVWSTGRTWHYFIFQVYGKIMKNGHHRRCIANTARGPLHYFSSFPFPHLSQVILRFEWSTEGLLVISSMRFSIWSLIRSWSCGTRSPLLRVVHPAAVIKWSPAFKNLTVLSLTGFNFVQAIPCLLLGLVPLSSLVDGSSSIYAAATTVLLRSRYTCVSEARTRGRRLSAILYRNMPLRSIKIQANGASYCQCLLSLDSSHHTVILSAWRGSQCFSRI